MYPKIKSDLVEYMSANPYVLVSDGSSDCEWSIKDESSLPLYFWCQKSVQLDLKFYSMCLISGEDCSKAETFLPPLMMLLKVMT